VVGHITRASTRSRSRPSKPPRITYVDELTWHPAVETGRP